MQIIQQFWREIIIFLLIIVVLFSVQRCEVNKRHADAVKQVHDSAYQVITYYKNKQKELVAQVQTHELTVADLKTNYQSLSIDKKKLEQQVGNLKNLVGFWKGKVQVSDTVTLVNHDTTIVEKGVETFAKYWDYNNGYLDARGLITETGTILQYDYKFDFELTPYRKRSGFLGFGKSTLVTDLTFSDPNIKVKEFTGIVIQEPKKKWYETKGAAAAIGFLAGLFLAK